MSRHPEAEASGEWEVPRDRDRDTTTDEVPQPHDSPTTILRFLHVSEAELPLPDVPLMVEDLPRAGREDCRLPWTV